MSDMTMHDQDRGRERAFRGREPAPPLVLFADRDMFDLSRRDCVNVAVSYVHPGGVGNTTIMVLHQRLTDPSRLAACRINDDLTREERRDFAALLETMATALRRYDPDHIELIPVPKDPDHE